MIKIIFIIVMLLILPNAYATDLATGIAVGIATSTAAEEEAKKQNNNTQIQIALCNKLITSEQQSSCLISLQNKLRQEQDEKDKWNRNLCLILFGIISLFVIFIVIVGARVG